MALVRAGYYGAVVNYGYNTAFLYPCSGRIESLIESLSTPVAMRIVTGQRIVRIDEKKKTILTHTGQRNAYQYLISTMPLNQLLAILKWPEADSTWLSYADVINTRVGFAGKILHPYHWLYVPDVAARFYRLGFPTNVSHETSPPGTASISIEYAQPQGVPVASACNIASEAITYLEQRRLIDCRHILITDQVRISPAYVHHRAKENDFFVKTRAKLAQRGIFLAGRYGEWDYQSMEESFMSGQAIATRILATEKV
jgi:protoporphyrinogen oxidase